MLQLKSIGVEDLVRFPYVTKPSAASIQASIKQLTILGAFKISERFKAQAYSSLKRSDSARDIDDVLQNSLFTSFEQAQAGTERKQGTDPTDITDLGILLSKIPLDPRCAKILVVASKYNLLHYAIMIVACMSVTEIHDEEAATKAIMKKANMPEYGKAEEWRQDQGQASEDSDLETQLDRDRRNAEKQEQVRRQKEQRKFVAAEIKK